MWKIKKTTEIAAKPIDKIEATMEQLTSTADSLVDPYRKSVAKRYPILFLLLVTFGVTATFLGLEWLIGEIAYLQDHPLLLLLLGIGTLVITGTLYKKLG